jgi:hypothetical protein
MDTLLPYVLWDEQNAMKNEVLAPEITGETTPYPSEGSFCVPVFVDSQMATDMLSALWAGAEIMYPEKYLEIITPFLQGLNRLGDCGDMPCTDAITGIRRSGQWLQVQRCNEPEWSNVAKLGGIFSLRSDGGIDFDFDGNDTPDQVIYQNSYQNIYGGGLPITSLEDQLCRAAFALAKQYCDAYSTMLGAVAGLDNFVAGAIQMLADWGIVTNIFDDSVEFFTQDWIQGTLDFLYSNAKTEQTVALAAELIYCAMYESYPDDMDDWMDNVDFGAYAPIVAVISGGKVGWENFGGLGTSIVNTGLGRFSAYLALGYAKTSIYYLAEQVRIYQPAKAIMEQAMATALYFDGRDCSTFACVTWEHTFEFDNELEGWQQVVDHAIQNRYELEATYIKTNDIQLDNATGWYRVLGTMEYLIEGGTTITQVTMQFGYAEGNDRYARFWLGGTEHDIDPSNSEAQEWDLHTTATVNRIAFSLYTGSQASQAALTGYGRVYSLTIKGTGENPFI